MNRADIHLLQSVHSAPAVSILVPTHAATGDSQQDPIYVKNSIRAAEMRLLRDFPRRDAEPVIQHLKQVAEEIDYRADHEGLAIFATRDTGLWFDLPFCPDELVKVDETLATGEIARGLNHVPRYWLVTLGGHRARLMEGTNDRLREVELAGFPLYSEESSVPEIVPGGREANPAVHPQEAVDHRLFLRRASESFEKILHEDPTPVVVVGIDRYLDLVRSENLFGDRRIAEISGNYDYMGPGELGRLVWPEVEQGFRAEWAKLLDSLEVATGKKLAAFGLQECWDAAQMNRGHHLLVEEGYRQPGRLGEGGLALEPMDDPEVFGADVLQDAVGELAELVVSKGGQVALMDNGSLADRGRVALILRF